MVDYTDPNWPKIVAEEEKIRKERRKLLSVQHRKKNERNRVWRTYAMTMDQIASLHRSQNGICANPGCSQKIKPYGRDRAVDHCHKTGSVRGMLCKSCNIALGLVRDSPKVLLGLVEYLAGNGRAPKDLLVAVTKAYQSYEPTRKPKPPIPAGSVALDALFKNNFDEDENNS